ncbi:Protein BTN1 [Lasiodiplodia hormozganensis]|uniref:Protein BTN n=1 Tax=Lasiodiplodia hormozganensis TaxID=869390 RepID=A0AA40CVL7_9PEZI|nr:Protein BTN1 [Lasiodiplodia hormozganensis]
MLPMPGTPAASWAVYKAKFKSVFEGADPRVCAAFWLFGLINNVLYVIILSAAVDLVGPAVPKGVVLLADVIPSFITKLIAPYFIHQVPYSVRICVFVGLSTAGMLLIALTPATRDGGAIGIRMLGIIFASLSSGGGELSFLGLTHFYGHFSLAAWGSGTGGAGLVGAGAYVLATTTIGLSVRTSLLAFSFLPVIMLAEYEQLGGDEDAEDDIQDPLEDGDGLLSGSMMSASGRSFTSLQSRRSKVWRSLQANLNRARHLVIPYMLPLLLVYIAEYTINQGVAPTLLFPLSSSPFSEYRAFYPTYNAIYQVGVFISRSSTPFFRIHHLYLPSFLQIANLVLLTAHAVWDFIPSVWIIFLIVFWEGLLGGLVYVSTFAEITDNVPKAEREFSLSATSVSDSAGICAAGFLGMALEVWLCEWQVAHGRDYCRRT